MNTPLIQSSLPASIIALSNTGNHADESKATDAQSFADSLKSHLSNGSTKVGDVSLNKTMEAKLKYQQQEIKKAGQDFESLFFSTMLKEMRKSISSEEGGGLFAGEGSDTYGGMFDSFIGQHMASSGQLGIAKTVESYLQNQRFGPDQETTANNPAAKPNEAEWIVPPEKISKSRAARGTTMGS